MNHLHSYIQADLKYNFMSENKKKWSTQFLKPRTQKGGVVFGNGNNNRNKFDIKTDKEYDAKRIFIGDIKRDVCMIGVIYTSNKTELILQTFNYYKKCNITNDLERGTGVRKMMKTYIKYIKQKYRKVKKIILTDEATFPCIDKLTDKLTDIPLYSYYLFKHGVPYYVLHHNFTFIDKEDEADHTLNLQSLPNIKLNYSNFEKYGSFKNTVIPEEVNSIINPEQEIYSYTEIKKIILDLAEFGYCQILKLLLLHIFINNTLLDLKGTTYYLNI